jgi:hypothetical protein
LTLERDPERTEKLGSQTQTEPKLGVLLATTSPQVNPRPAPGATNEPRRELKGIWHRPKPSRATNQFAQRKQEKKFQP